MVGQFTDSLDTTGCLDVARIEGDTLRVSGWSAAFDGSLIDGVGVTWRGQPLTLLELRTGLPSPDVAEALPRLPAGRACRFELLTRAPGQHRDILIVGAPTSGSRHGRRLFHFIDPALPEPPGEHVAAIGGSFLNLALDMLDCFIGRCGLEPDAQVLDVGCGVGRIAYVLAYYLNDDGRYDGFDVMPPLVEWATANIAAARPNFRFQHVNIANRMYNASGMLRADSFRFPYPDASFDFVTATSVFTHIPGKEVRHYLDEMARVLVPGGRVLATAFVLDSDVHALIQQGRSTLPLEHRHGDGYVSDLRVPEAAIGYEDGVLRQWIEASGFRPATLLPGTWCGRERGFTYQDVLVLEADDGTGAAAAARRSRTITSLLARWRDRLRALVRA